MLVVPRDGDATLVVPRLEAPRVVEQPGVFTLLPWDETDDPIALVARLAGRRGDGRRSATRCGPASSSSCCRSCPATEYRRAVDVDRPAARCARTPPRSPRSRAAGAAVDRVAAAAAGRRDPAGRAHRGRRSSPTSRARLIAEGHDKVNFAIVAAGANAASPAPPRRRPGHRATARSCCATSAARWTATAATSPAACSSATPPAEIAEAYAVLHEAQAAARGRRHGRHAVRGRRPGRPRGSSPPPATASTSSTAPVTASAWRSTRTRTSSRATPAARRRSRLQRRARHLRRRAVGDAPRGHRRRHRRRARAAQRTPTTRWSSSTPEPSLRSPATQAVVGRSLAGARSLARN